ncbi:MAG: Tar ligand binding domain-containing protein, partial [Burkholderiaceae bacterium]|nr:Tar ligand binding domain-containing protein [Burkholderiaceae bacterium]
MNDALENLPTNANTAVRKKNRAAKPPRAETRRRLRDARVGTLLLMLLGMFALTIAAVGGMAAYFLQQNFVAVQELGELTARSKQVQDINTDMLRARADMLVAAQLKQAGQIAEAVTPVKSAVDRLDSVRERFSTFQNDMLQDDEGRQLSMNIVRRYRAYIDDCVDTMVEALRSNDYTTFYMVNMQYGNPRSVSFSEAIAAFGIFIERRQSEIEARAEQTFFLAIAAVVGAVLL